MTKFLSLLKLQFTQQFRALPVKGKKKGGVIAAFVVLGLCFLPIIISIVASMYFLGTIAGNNAGVLFDSHLSRLGIGIWLVHYHIAGLQLQGCRQAVVFTR